jgi:hypothetical protein
MTSPKKALLHAQLLKQANTNQTKIPLTFGAVAKVSLTVKYVYLLSLVLMWPVGTITVVFLLLFIKYY